MRYFFRVCRPADRLRVDTQTLHVIIQRQIWAIKFHWNVSITLNVADSQADYFVVSR